MERYKARLVAMVITTMKHSVQLSDWNPIVAIQYVFKWYQVDVTTAFLSGKLEEEVYMRQPEGFITQGKNTWFANSTKVYMA